MNKENCTKGPVHIDRDEQEARGIAISDGAGLIADVGPLGPADEEDEANAELITEAFNVLNETGMTPRELADLLPLIKRTLGRMTDGTIEVLRYGSGEEDVATLETLLSKYQPVTPA